MPSSSYCSTSIQNLAHLQEVLDAINGTGGANVNDWLSQLDGTLHVFASDLQSGDYDIYYADAGGIYGNFGDNYDFALYGEYLTGGGNPRVDSINIHSGSTNIDMYGTLAGTSMSGSVNEVRYQVGGNSFLYMMGRLNPFTGAGTLTSFGVRTLSASIIYEGSLRLTSEGGVSGTVTYLYFDGGAGEGVFEATGLRLDAAKLGTLFNLSDPSTLLPYILSGNDTIENCASDQIVYGYAGNDTLVANGYINVTLAGGIGNDTYRLNYNPTIVELPGEGIDRVEALNYSHELADNVENLVLAGIYDIDGTGNALANTITGNAGANVLDGGEAADRLAGGLGDDTYVVDVSASGARVVLQDRITETGGSDTLVLRALTDWGLAVPAVLTLAANLENLDASDTGTNRINLTGNALANTIIGNAGDNVINGGLGNDTLIGSDGNDTLKNSGGVDSYTGGVGADCFVIHSVSALVAEIADFEAGVDAIGLGRKAYGVLFSNGALNGNVFDNGTEATTFAQRLFYNAGTGGLWYDSDGRGVAAAVQVATLTNKPASLAAGDFILAMVN